MCCSASTISRASGLATASARPTRRPSARLRPASKYTGYTHWNALVRSRWSRAARSRSRSVMPPPPGWARCVGGGPEEEEVGAPPPPPSGERSCWSMSGEICDCVGSMLGAREDWPGRAKSKASRSISSGSEASSTSSMRGLAMVLSAVGLVVGS